MGRFAEVAGEALRAARRRKRLTLRGVWRRSRGEFKPSALGGYERGERAISLDKFCSLAEIYGVPADRLLGDVLDRLHPDGRRRVVVDLNALAELGDTDGRQWEGARSLGRFVHAIRSRRGDFLTNVVSLRAGDLESFSMKLGIPPETLLKWLTPAVRDSGAGQSPPIDEDEEKITVT
jgi:transcriptional regulator with XRE-family HTH domain